MFDRSESAARPWRRAAVLWLRILQHLVHSAPQQHSSDAANDQSEAHQGSDDPYGGARAVPPNEDPEAEGEDCVQQNPIGPRQRAVAEEADDTDNSLNYQDDAEHQGECQQSKGRMDGDVEAADEVDAAYQQAPEEGSRALA